MSKNVQPVRMVGFIQSIKNFFLKYVDFSGTSTRAEYWWVVLAMLGLGIIALIFLGVNIFLLGDDIGSVFTGFMLLPVVLALIIPSISLFVRRIHDAGFSAWWYYVPLLVWFVVAVMAAVTQELDMGYIARAFGVLDWMGDMFTNGLVLAFAILPSKLQDNPYRR